MLFCMHLFITIDLAKAAADRVLGRYSYAWTSWVEKSGDMMCEQALQCHEHILSALDAAKTGVDVPIVDKLLKIDHPHYLKAPKPMSGTKDRQCDEDIEPDIYFPYKTVIGKLFEMCKPAKRVTAQYLPKMDPDITTLGSSNEELVEEWTGHLRAFKMSFFNEDNGQNKSISFDENIERYRDLFNESAQSMAEFECREIFLDRNFTEGKSKSIRDNMLSQCRIILAAIIYKITYEQGGDIKQYPISFCWYICASELHAIKRTAVLIAEGDSVFRGMPRSEMKFLLGK